MEEEKKQIRAELQKRLAHGFQEANNEINKVKENFVKPFQIAMGFEIVPNNFPVIMPQEISEDSKKRKEEFKKIGNKDREHDMIGYVKQIEDLIVQDYQMMVIGGTNFGKSTFLNNVTAMRNFFNTSVSLETANLWKFKLVQDNDQPQAAVIRREYKDQDEEGKKFEKPEQISEDVLLNNIEEVLLDIKKFKRSEIQNQGAQQDIMSPQDEQQKTMGVIEYSIRESLVKDSKFSIINNKINIVDIPGIDDSFYCIQINSYIEENIDRTMPVILIALTCGGFSDLKHFASLIPTLKKLKIPPVVVFTKFENLINDISAKHREEINKALEDSESSESGSDDEEESEDSEKEREKKKQRQQKEKVLRAQYEKLKIQRAQEVISKFSTDVAGHFPQAKFFIFNPAAGQYVYKFEYEEEKNGGRFKKLEIKDLTREKEPSIPEDFVKITDIVPIRVQIDQYSDVTVPTVYMNEVCGFMVRHANTYLEDLIVNCQDDSEANVLHTKLFSHLQKFKEDCEKKGNYQIDMKMQSIKKKIRLTIEDYKNKEKAKGIFTVGTFNEALVKQIFDKFHSEILELQRELKGLDNQDSIIKVQEKKLDEEFKKLKDELNISTSVPDIQPKKYTLEEEKIKSDSQNSEERKMDLHELFKKELESKEDGLIAKKWVINPFNQMWTEGRQKKAATKFEEKFFEIFESKDYQNRIKSDFKDYIDAYAVYLNGVIAQIIANIRYFEEPILENDDEKAKWDKMNQKERREYRREILFKRLKLLPQCQNIDFSKAKLLIEEWIEQLGL